MTHLNELQRIASISNGTRAINTVGFNRTIDYLTDYLSAYTDFKITKNFFPVTDFVLTQTPILHTSIEESITNHTYSMDNSVTEFRVAHYSGAANFSNFIPMTVIPNAGCLVADWLAAAPPATGRVVLVKRGQCSFIETSALAAKFNVSAILFYNDGTSSTRMEPMSVYLGPNNSIPVLSLSFNLGERLVSATRISANNVGVLLSISLIDNKPVPVSNICADTSTGDPTRTIVIGSHSDSVRSGPGINDNGSGSAAILALATTLARLFRTSAYTKYEYRIRFCWWGAEELGLFGSEFHVAQARNSTIVGERLTDYLAYLNFDMLGSPNFRFGIYDARTAQNDTLQSAVSASFKISEMFREWFIAQNLPWDYIEFEYGSDYVAFLMDDIPVGGLFSGANEIKTQEERDRYDESLGQGQGGLANIFHDPCYHQMCDSIQNINVLGYKKMVQAAAYAIESLARKSDLKAWLYSKKDI
ncbi:unnamed protein product [Rotaria sp. Silwood2]|nr:unnamed protein product [Rotaria sp. Silwood2]CAF3054711.1 unnamed protein product [Rotaria sp. Silwood2]CAF3461992.1 unnamed protein product [Rotaria sp. Silwood2]CAF4075931.1 unnamed protein product [Rotaria sp. Silwood2]CAF4143833.1 unnamed protein product [Rotaria sp. Silwood2]